MRVWIRPWVILPALALPALWPLISLGLPDSEDGALHLIRLILLDFNLQQGISFPRWIPELLLGLSYPVFGFYGPTSYYVAEAFRLLGMGPYAAMSAAFAVFLLIGGFGMYRLAVDVFGPSQRWAALMAAVAYLYAPYFLTNVYIRGANAEAGAQALLPWVFWSFGRLVKSDQPTTYVLPATLSFGGLATMHNITMLFAPLALLGYVGLLWWTHGHQSKRLFWIVASLLAALGISAFFWLPVIGERQYLSQLPYREARKLMVGGGWTWNNFLDKSLFYSYASERPFQLGLFQIAMALAGLLLARRRDAEWLYFLCLALVAGLAASVWAVPLWLNNELLLIAQFQWRLLSILCLPLALFSGGVVLRVRPGPWQAWVALVGAGVIILANMPRLGSTLPLARDMDTIGPPAVAHFETEITLGTTAGPEFRPRWSLYNEYYPQGEQAVVPTAMSIERVGLNNLTATLASAGGPLRFTTLYYPGWRAVLDSGQEIPTYPSTTLGLLTVDLPPGAHRLSVSLTATGWQRAGTAISLFTLLALTWFCWRQRAMRWLAMIPLALLVAGGFAALRPLPSQALETPAQPIRVAHTALLGYRVEQTQQPSLIVRPYWFVAETPAESLWIGWQLHDAGGRVVSETLSQPYFNASKASSWPPGTIVDDGYELVLPATLPSGHYQLWLGQAPAGGLPCEWSFVGDLDLDATDSSEPVPSHPLAVHFGDAVLLAGYDVEIDGVSHVSTSDSPIVAHPGDDVVFQLYWKSTGPIAKDYHGFVHLVDQDGDPLAKLDQLAGGFARPSRLWSSSRLRTDPYTLRIPSDARSGLYWPTVGLYDPSSVDLLPVREEDAAETQSGVYRLAPLKVLAVTPHVAPEHIVDARLGDVATLLGYDLDLSETEVQAGSQFTLTLYYRSLAPTAQDLTQFIQLYSPQLGMVAQMDAPPLDGSNPTSAWIRDELIVESRTLRIAENAKPGVYSLNVGLYNPLDGTRLPVVDRSGTQLADGQIALTELVISP